MPNQAQRRASVGWGILSDADLIHFWDHYEGTVAETFMPVGFREQLDARGLVIGECSECGKHQVRQQHDYICIACRKGWGHA